MNTRQKAHIEWLIMRSFRDNYPDFPKGKLTKSETPDFIHKLSLTKSIGIEISTLYKSLNIGSAESQMRSIIYRAHELYLERFRNPIFAQIFFNSDFTIPINDEIYSTKIAIAIIDIVAEQKIGAQYMSHIEPDILPSGVSRIIIYAHPTFKNSFWDLRFELNVQDIFNSGSLEKLVDKKDEKLRLYRKKITDLYWLIISADYINKPASFNFENALNQIKLETGFNKVFLYNLFEQKYFELV
jgi:hypothetical protein